MVDGTTLLANVETLCVLSAWAHGCVVRDLALRRQEGKFGEVVSEVSLAR